jgi:hypothetical protein
MSDPKYTIALKEYDYDLKETVSKGEVSVHLCAKSMTFENFCYLLSEFMNMGGKDFRDGLRVGESFHSEHRTLQGLAVRFCLGIIVGLSKQEYTDARNETAVKACKKIAKMIEDDELQMGYMI